MALAATGDVELAEQVGRAIGTEALAMGVNVLYAPSCDLATSPANPHLGIRSFGDDPTQVGAFAAAMVRGIRSAGAAATIKHFPGLGEADLDTHLALPALAGRGTAGGTRAGAVRRGDRGRGGPRHVRARRALAADRLRGRCLRPSPAR